MKHSVRSLRSPPAPQSGVRRGLQIAVCALGIAGFIAGSANAEPFTFSSKSSGYVEKSLDRVAPYSEKNRWRTYLAVNKTYGRVWDDSRNAQVLATGRTSTIRGVPHLSLEDRDGDGRADFYFYAPSPKSDNTREFGGVFDLSGDGKPDWLIFYGGSAMVKKGSGFRITYWNHHAVDRNADGTFDLLIIDGIDTDGDGMIEQGLTAWVYDDNFDGRADRGEHIRKGKVTPIAVRNGRLDWKAQVYNDLRERPEIGGKFDLLRTFDKFLRDIEKIRPR